MLVQFGLLLLLGACQSVQASGPPIAGIATSPSAQEAPVVEVPVWELSGIGSGAVQAKAVGFKRDSGISLRTASYEAYVEVHPDRLSATVYDTQLNKEFDPWVPFQQAGGEQHEFVPRQWISGPLGQLYVMGEFGSSSGAFVTARLNRQGAGSEVEWQWSGIDSLVVDERLASAFALTRLPEGNRYAAISTAGEVLVIDAECEELFGSGIVVPGATQMIPGVPEAGLGGREEPYDLLVIGRDESDVLAFFYFDGDHCVESLVRQHDDWVLNTH